MVRTIGDFLGRGGHAFLICFAEKSSFRNAQGGSWAKTQLFACIMHFPSKFELYGKSKLVKLRCLVWSLGYSVRNLEIWQNTIDRSYFVLTLKISIRQNTICRSRFRYSNLYFPCSFEHLTYSQPVYMSHISIRQSALYQTNDSDYFYSLWLYEWFG